MKSLKILYLLPLMIIFGISLILIEINSLFPYIKNFELHNPDSSREEKFYLFSDIIEPSTRFIAHWTLKKWSMADFLIVIGIPSEDIPPRKRLRDLQREYCWSYDGVATLANNYTGVITVLYVLGRSPSNQFKYSTALKAEAQEWQDVLTLPIKEGNKSTSKQIGGGGFWGIDAEIGMSLKTFLWFYMALRLFPKALHVAKADDDIFIHVPAYLKTLRVLPRKGIYWGSFADRNPIDFGAVTHNNSFVSYAFGSCMALAKDVVERFLSYKPLHRMIFLPYNERRINEFRLFAMQHEDVMVGVVLNNLASTNIVYVNEPFCRFHNVHIGKPISPVTTNSMVIYHVREPDHKQFREFFQNNSNLTEVIIYRNEFVTIIGCHPGALSLSL